jgi:uncharacterized membrane protein
MSGYGISLFLHMIGVVLLLGAALMMHLMGSRVRRAATVEEVRIWLGFGRSIQLFFPIAALFLLLTGLHLTGTGWDFRQPWIIVALVGLLALLPVGPVLQRPRFMAMGMAAEKAGSGRVPPELRALLLNPTPWRLLSATTGVGLGNLWIMTQKAGWIGSLVPPLLLGLLGWVYGGMLASRDQAASESPAEPVASSPR